MKKVLYDYLQPEDVIGKYAWNPTWQVGGIIIAIDSRSVTIGGGIYTTCTGDCPMDSLVINGFDVYDLEAEVDKTKGRDH